MIKNLSKKIAIFFSIIISINFILYDDVYAYEDKSSGIVINESEKKVHGNKSNVEFNVFNKGNADINNLDITVKMPKSLNCVGSLKFSKNKLKVGDKVTYSIKSVKENNNKVNFKDLNLIIIALIIIVFLLIILIKKKKRKTTISIILLGILLTQASLNVYGKEISNSFCYKQNIKVNNKNYQCTINVKYKVFKCEEISLNKEDNSKLQFILEELYDYQNRNLKSQNCDKVMNLPDNDNSKLELIDYLINDSLSFDMVNSDNKIKFSDVMHWNSDNSKLNISEEEVNNILDMAIGSGIKEPTNSSYYYNGIYQLLAGNRGDEDLYCNINNIKEVSENEIFIEGKVGRKSSDANEEDNFAARAKKNGKSIFGGYTITDFKCGPFLELSQKKNEISEESARLLIDINDGEFKKSIDPNSYLEISNDTIFSKRYKSLWNIDNDDYYCFIYTSDKYEDREYPYFLHQDKNVIYLVGKHNRLVYRLRALDNMNLELLKNNKVQESLQYNKKSAISNCNNLELAKDVYNSYSIYSEILGETMRESLSIIPVKEVEYNNNCYNRKVEYDESSTNMYLAINGKYNSNMELDENLDATVLYVSPGENSDYCYVTIQPYEIFMGGGNMHSLAVVYFKEGLIKVSLSGNNDPMQTNFIY